MVKIRIMKRKYIMNIVLLAFIFTSCDKWLDVKPELDIYEETLFEKAQGYYIALNGLYIDMSGKHLYGQELTWGAIEAWGRSYNLHEKAHASYLEIVNFEYDKKGAKSIAASIWLDSYKVIAEANNLIQNLENDGEVKFKYGEVTKNMILAEAYAIRAIMHFELLRIFAKAPVADNGGESAFIPYVTEYPSIVNSPVETKNVLKYLIADLEKAKEWIKPFDTDVQYPGGKTYSSAISTKIKLDNGSGESISDDEFFRYRANRLNYYAITQLLARVCLYAGEKDKAFENANEIVKLVDKGIGLRFVAPGYIGDPMVLSSVEPRLHSEILFAPYNSTLSTWTNNYFSSDAQNNTLNLNDKNGIFETNPSDVRLKAIPKNMVTKFSLEGRDESNMIAAKSLEPVLRGPECYYIAAEAIFDKDRPLAVEIFNKVVNARNNSVYNLNTDVDKEAFMEALVKEYRREFLCEGQMVYVYKRLNLPLRENGTTVAHNGKLVMPVPDTEAGIQ
jgi:hypothetical protein